MLVLSRKIGESVIIDGRITVTVVRVDGESVRLGVHAPQDVPVHRQEVYEEIRRNNCQALTQQRPRLPKLPRLPGKKPGLEVVPPAQAAKA
jgi:carbon storage regulator